MLTYEEEGIKQSFKITLSSKGLIIKTHGALSSSYKEVYSHQYEKVGNIVINNRFILTEFIVGGILLRFEDENAARVINILLNLGKTNPNALQSYIGNDGEETDIDDIDVDELEDYADKNKFASKNESSQEEISPEVPSQKLSMTSPPPPPVFRLFALIDGKQEGPYDEPQFERLVKYGVVDKDTYVWHEGLSEWKQAFMVGILSKFFKNNQTGSTPPPTFR